MSFDGAICQGWLVKAPPMSNVRSSKKWRKRYCALCPGRGLYYCNKADASTTKGRIDLDEVLDCYVVDHAKIPSVLGVSTPNRIYYFQAASDDERGLWIKDIRQACPRTAATQSSNIVRHPSFSRTVLPSQQSLDNDNDDFDDDEVAIQASLDGRRVELIASAGEYTLTVNYLDGSRNNLAVWPLDLLRSFGSKGNRFHVQSGSRTTTGVRTFSFETMHPSDAEDLKTHMLDITSSTAGMDASQRNTLLRERGSSRRSKTGPNPAYQSTKPTPTRPLPSKPTQPQPEQHTYDYIAVTPTAGEDATGRRTSYSQLTFSSGSPAKTEAKPRVPYDILRFNDASASPPKGGAYEKATVGQNGGRRPSGSAGRTSSYSQMGPRQPGAVPKDAGYIGDDVQTQQGNRGKAGAYAQLDMDDFQPPAQSSQPSRPTASARKPTLSQAKSTTAYSQIDFEKTSALAASLTTQQSARASGRRTRWNSSQEEKESTVRHGSTSHIRPQRRPDYHDEPGEDHDEAGAVCDEIDGLLEEIEIGQGGKQGYVNLKFK
eukprot:TRINITY_DN12165_c0_g4_i5.p1 TRINITY_DN12165_c0_g4~~TRINITY_DN12165_c0_g4_i5.p1  ORF type:complete len:544 (+),score=93.93 TRINITY_DN12165_c0_g4_i5:64-1695(+)